MLQHVRSRVSSIPYTNPHTSFVATYLRDRAQVAEINTSDVVSPIFWGRCVIYIHIHIHITDSMAIQGIGQSTDPR